MAQTTAEQIDTSTLAGRVRAAGGGMLPEVALEIAHQRELRIQALLNDPKISNSYRQEQLLAIDQHSEAEMWRARDAAVAAVKKAAEAKKGQILAAIRAQYGPSSGGPIETSSEQAERHHRSTREALSLLPDLMVAQAETEPEALRDMFEEAIRAEDHTRIRKFGPVIVSRLSTLAEQKHDGAADAWQMVASQLRTYKQKHPSLNQQLRAAEEELRTAADPIDRQFQSAMDYFKVGAASKSGIRL